MPVIADRNLFIDNYVKDTPGASREDAAAVYDRLSVVPNTQNTQATSSTILGEGNSQVALAGSVDFDPQAVLQQALTNAREQGGFNRDVFLDSFNNLADKLASDTLNSEAAGLEQFVPRASALIREQDGETNNELLTQSDIFDNRNLNAADGATRSSTALRREIFDSYSPGVRDSLLSSLDRLDGDNARIRERESNSILTDELKEVGSRSARFAGADAGAASGFGINSGATASFIDRFDLDKRIALEEGELARQRQGDNAIFNSENALQGAAAANANLFNNIIAPGIQDFRASQPGPVVTDIGGQISPTPSVDAGTLRRGFTNELTNLQSISPTTVFNESSSLEQSKLAFEQSILNAEADGLNSLFDKEEQLSREERANAAFEQGREDGEPSLIEDLVAAGVTTAAGLQAAGISLDDIRNYLLGKDSTPEGKFPDHTGHYNVDSADLAQELKDNPGLEKLEEKDGVVTVGFRKGGSSGTTIPGSSRQTPTGVNADGTLDNSYRDYSTYDQTELNDDLGRLIGDIPGAVGDMSLTELLDARNNKDSSVSPLIIQREIERRARIQDLARRGATYRTEINGEVVEQDLTKYTDPNSDYVNYGGSSNLSQRDIVNTDNSGHRADGSARGTFAGGGGVTTNFGGSFGDNVFSGTEFDPQANLINEEEAAIRYNEVANINTENIHLQLLNQGEESSVYNNTFFPEPSYESPYPSGILYPDSFQIAPPGWVEIGPSAVPNSRGQSGTILQYRGNQ